MAGEKHSSEPETIWLTTEQLARRLGLSTDALERWRIEGKGPTFRKMPGRGDRTPVRYKLSDVEAWEATWQTVDTSEVQQNMADAATGEYERQAAR
jgi:hypothetical protein